MPVTVQVIRFATPSSGLFCRVMTWSPTPTRSPSEPWVTVVSSTAPAVTSCSLTTSLIAEASPRGFPREVAERVRLGVPDLDVPALVEVVEHLLRIDTGADPQRQIRVLGVRLVVGGAEPVHRPQFDLGGRPPGDHLEDPAAADGRELPAVPDEHHPRIG